MSRSSSMNQTSSKSPSTTTTQHQYTYSHITDDNNNITNTFQHISEASTSRKNDIQHSTHHAAALNQTSGNSSSHPNDHHTTSPTHVHHHSSLSTPSTPSSSVLVDVPTDVNLVNTTLPNFDMDEAQLQSSSNHSIQSSSAANIPSSIPSNSAKCQEFLRLSRCDFPKVLVCNSTNIDIDSTCTSDDLLSSNSSSMPDPHLIIFCHSKPSNHT